MRLLDEERPDLVVLDLALASGSGYSLCGLMRHRSNVSILIVTSLGDESDRIRGPDMGADDYLVKPVGLPELMARIKALLRRERMSIARGINMPGHRWGLSWQITPIALTNAVTDPDPAVAKRAFDAMMQMKKIDIAAIEAARRG